MPTSSEKRALLFLASVAALGIGVRAVRGGGQENAGSGDALARQIAAVDSVAARERSDRGGRKRMSSRPRRSRRDTLDISDVSDDVPARTPRSSGAVPGPFSLSDRRRGEVADANRASQERLDELTRVLTVSPQPVRGRPAARTRTERSPVDIDTADEETIATVPWIGPVLASRIMAERTRRGTFGSLEGLQRVAGIGPRVAARIASHVRFSGTGMGPTLSITSRNVRP